jgi:hypothetical protein
VHDAHGQEKTADNLLEHLLSVIKEVETGWGCHVVAVCSDASGESRKARRLLREKFPYLVTPDCYAHQVCKYFNFDFFWAQNLQINLVVGDFFKCNSGTLRFVDLADDLITWLRSKTSVLALISEACKSLGGETTGSSVIRAVITRWTAHYLAYSRLIALRPALTMVVTNDVARVQMNFGSKLVTGNPAARAKAERMVEAITNQEFWESLVM